jgi:hypothetical protein
MRPKISRDRQRIQGTLKRHGHDAAVRLAIDIELRKESTAKRPPSKALRREMIQDDGRDWCYPPPFLTRVTRKHISLDGETK